MIKDSACGMRVQKNTVASVKGTVGSVLGLGWKVDHIVFLREIRCVPAMGASIARFGNLEKNLASCPCLETDDLRVLLQFVVSDSSQVHIVNLEDLRCGIIQKKKWAYFRGRFQMGTVEHGSPYIIDRTTGFSFRVNST